MSIVASRHDNESAVRERPGLRCKVRTYKALRDYSYCLKVRGIGKPRLLTIMMRKSVAGGFCSPQTHPRHSEGQK